MTDILDKLRQAPAHNDRERIYLNAAIYEIELLEGLNERLDRIETLLKRNGS